jgi:hypothetical protein
MALQAVVHDDEVLQTSLLGLPFIIRSVMEVNEGLQHPAHDDPLVGKPVL